MKKLWLIFVSSCLNVKIQPITQQWIDRYRNKCFSLLLCRWGTHSNRACTQVLIPPSSKIRFVMTKSRPGWDCLVCCILTFGQTWGWAPIWHKSCQGVVIFMVMSMALIIYGLWSFQQGQPRELIWTEDTGESAHHPKAHWLVLPWSKGIIFRYSPGGDF